MFKSGKKRCEKPSNVVKVLRKIKKLSETKKEPHCSLIFSPSSSARRLMRYSNSFVWLRFSFFASSSRSCLSLADNMMDVFFFFMSYPPFCPDLCPGLCITGDKPRHSARLNWVVSFGNIRLFPNLTVSQKTPPDKPRYMCR